MSDLVTKDGARNRVLNPRAALILALIVGASVFGMRRLHDKQISRTLEFLRETAYKSIDAKDYRGAQLQLSQYLAMRRSDLEAREKLSWLLTEHIRTPQALEQAVRLNEDLLRKGMANDELRLRQARISVQLKRLTDAEAHLKLLQTSRPNDAEVWYLSAVAADAARHADEATRYLKRSLRCSVKVPEAYALLAKLATDRSPAEFQPESLMKQMITQCPSGQAYHIRADYNIAKNHYEQATADLWMALADSPDDMILNAKLVRCVQAFEVSNSSDAASINVQAKTVQRAITHFNARIKEASQNPTLRLHLAAVLWKNKNRRTAIEALEAGIQAMPRSFSLHEALIEYLVSENDGKKARRILESIPAGALSREVYNYSHGRVLMTEKKWKEAATALEQTLAYAKKESGLFSRAQMSYAVCRSRSGESRAALDAFRTVVADNPSSTAARLGIAAAWAKSGQIDFAIAEYRQLTEIQGVNACLADLLIQKNLLQPSSLRDWSEVDELTREENPRIEDPVQRALLRADRFFASGQILPAINTLEHAKIVHSNRREVASALKRIQGDMSAGLNQRLEQLSKEEPLNPEVHAALTRMVISSQGLPAAMAMIEELTNAGQGSSATKETSLLLVVRTLNQVIFMERQYGRNEFVDALQQASIAYAHQLADANPKHERELVRTLVRSGRSADAMKLLAVPSENVQPEMRAAALIEAVRSASPRESVVSAATQTLFALISQHPANHELRLSYAELMLFARRYDLAEQTLAPLAAVSRGDGRIIALRAWLRTAEESKLDEAIELVNEAIRSDARQSVYREVHARILLTKNEPQAALKILKDIPSGELSLAGQVYLVTSLLKLDRDAEARVAFDQLHALSDTDALFPADEDLYQLISDEILQPATAKR